MGRGENPEVLAPCREVWGEGGRSQDLRAAEDRSFIKPLGAATVLELSRADGPWDFRAPCF